MQSEQAIESVSITTRVRAVFAEIRNNPLPFVCVFLGIYYICLGSAAGSIASNSIHATDGIEKIDEFPGGFYFFVLFMSIFDIFGGILILIIFTKYMYKKHIGSDPDVMRNVLYSMICAIGTITFCVAIRMYVNYIDLGKEYIEMKYDVIDSRYSSFIAAQLSTIILNSVQTLIVIFNIVKCLCGRCDE